MRTHPDIGLVMGDLLQLDICRLAQCKLMKLLASSKSVNQLGDRRLAATCAFLAVHPRHTP